MKFVKSLLPYVGIVIFVVIIRTYLVTPVQVVGHSMDPSLEDGQLLILNKTDKNLERYDIVVLHNMSPKIIKRVIGLPGEAVRYKDGELLINNVVVEDDFADITEDHDFGVIEEGHYIVLGDNRTHSSDSRVFGEITTDDVEGTVIFSMLPFDRIGKVE